MRSADQYDDRYYPPEDRTHMPVYQLHDLSLQDLIEGIHSGRIRLPEFQRSFQWQPKARRELLDSIQKGFPVGTLLLMEVGHAGPGPFGQRPFVDTPPTLDVKGEMLVLDGQQRLTTCYVALRATGTKKVYALRLRELFNRTNGKPDVPVDFLDLVDIRARPALMDRLLFNNHLLPLEFLTDRLGLRRRLATYRQQLALNPETADFAAFIETDLEGYLDVFFDYRFPTVVLSPDLDLEGVCNIFTKINSTGTKLSAFDLCVAIMFPSGVNLRNLLDQAWTSEAVRRVDNDGTNILQTVALLVGKSPKKASLPKNVTPGDVTSRWDDAVAGLQRTAHLLEGVGVWDYASIPYDALVPALGAIFAPSGGIGDTVQVRETLRARVGKWVYGTAVGEEYNEGTDVKQLQHFVAAKTWLEDASTPNPAFLSEPRFWSAETTKGGLGGARARAFMAALNQMGAPDFMTRESLGHGADRKSADKHHIFPRAYLQANGYARGEIQRVLNMTFLLPDTNKFIDDRAPSVYINDLVKRRAVNDNTDEALARNSVKKMLERHFIDEAGYDALIANDYDAFLAARATSYRDYLQNEFGVVTVEAPTSSEGDETEPDELGDVDETSGEY